MSAGVIADAAEIATSLRRVIMEFPFLAWRRLDLEVRARRRATALILHSMRMPAPLMTGLHLSISARRWARELLRRRSDHLIAELSEALPGRGLGQRRRCVGAHLSHDVWGRPGRNEQPKPRRDVEARHAGLRDGRNIGRHGDPLRAPEIARPRIWPALIRSSTTPLANIMSTRPGMRSLNAGAEPR